MLPDPLDREAHNIEIGALDAGDAHVADPLLDGICPGFVEWLVSIYVIRDFFLRKRLEPNLGCSSKCVLQGIGADGDGGSDVVLSA